MNYKSPIELIASQMNLAIEGEICKAVQNVGVIVEKEELLKALKYDRNQYQKGYSDRDDEIVRCKDCKNWTKEDDRYLEIGMCRVHERRFLGNWFCADGECE